MNNFTKISTKLERLLEQEYASLLGGDLAGIERLGAEKVVLLEAFAETPIEDVEGLSKLRSRLIRNQVLAQSAIEGMRTAIQRAREVSDVATSLRTYRKDGQKNALAVRIGDALSKRS